ncbi:Syntaxin-10 [Coemansia sp. RSA 1694]|nr:Syntaxin-10 [Coemansia sp. RSA 1694]
MADPFVIVQEDVTASFEQAKTLLVSWRRLSGKRRSPQEENEYQFMTDEIYSTANSINADLDELQETIGVAREAPEDYGLTSAQISERQAFVATGRKALEEMRRALAQPVAKAAAAGAKASGRAGDSRRNESEHHTVEFNHHQGQQQVLMEQQDEHLDAMLDTVRNLHGIAGTMNTELDDQAILLDEMGGMVDRTQSKLAAARKSVDKFLRDKNNRSLHVILILFAVMLVLIVLVIFT